MSIQPRAANAVRLRLALRLLRALVEAAVIAGFVITLAAIVAVFTVWTGA